MYQQVEMFAFGSKLCINFSVLICLIYLFVFFLIMLSVVISSYLATL